MKRPQITLCMIVKDEEESLADCLNSASPLVDDMIIVDTGSTDQTKKIAKQFTRCVYDYTWRDDFADARNFALNQSDADWVLWLDADERLVIENKDLWLKTFIEKFSNYDAFLLPLENYYGPAPTNAHMYLYQSFRLMSVRSGLRYKQSIHEHFDLSQGEFRLAEEPLLGVTVRHFGYLDHYVEKKEKHNRNFKLLEKEKRRHDYDPWIDYHIASEYYRRKDYHAAFENVNQCIYRFIENEKIPPSLAYKLKYEILLATGSLNNALDGIDRALMIYPDYVDLHYYKGLIHYKKEQYEEAIDAFQTCVDLGEDAPYLILKGVGSYMAMYMIGKSHEAIGRVDDAISVYDQLVKRYQEFQPPMERLKLLVERG